MPQRRLTLLVVALATLALLAAACSDDDTTVAGSDTTSTPAPPDDDGTAEETPQPDDDGTAEETPQPDDDGTAEDTPPPDDDGTAEDTPPPDEEAPGETGPVVETAVTELGEILVSGGYTLYAFTPDPSGESTCTGDCAALWPPLFASGAPTGAGAVDTDLLSVIERPDGSQQVAYGDRPLYFYAPDGPGDTSGQGVGGIWFVVTPAGDLVRGGSGGVGY